MNLSHYAVLVSVYASILSVIGSLLFPPISILLAFSSSHVAFKISYSLKKLSLVFNWFFIFLYMVFPCLWFISLFIENISSLDIFLTYTKMAIFGFLIWACSLLVYLIFIVILSFFGVTALSLNQLKKQLKTW